MARRHLPLDPGELIKLCERAGWEKIPNKNTALTVFQAKSGGRVAILHRKGGEKGARTIYNTIAQLRQHGLEADLDVAEREAEEARRTKIARGVLKFVPPSAEEEQQPAPAIRGEAPTLRVELVTVTPKQAAEWLERPPARLPDGRTIQQRPPNYFHLASIRKAMEEGKFVATHQAIALAPDAEYGNTGAVLDGQHRLWAVVESGLSVPMYVAFNADPAHFDKVDVGRNRTYSDLAAIQSFEHPGYYANTAKLVWAWHNWRQLQAGDADADERFRNWTSWDRIKPPTEHQQWVIDLYPELPTHLKRAVKFNGPPARLNVASGALFIIWTTQRWPECDIPASPDEKSMLERWLFNLRTKSGMDYKSGAHLFLGWAEGSSPKLLGTGSTRTPLFFGLIKAWNLDVAGETRDVLRIARNQELPVPYSPHDKRGRASKPRPASA